MSLDTRGYDPQRLLPQSLEDRLLGWMGRVGGCTLLAAVAVVWLCLLTWSVGDPSLTHATTNEPANAFGRLGAIFSDLLLQTVGFGAVVALVAPLVWSVELVRAERIASGRLKLGFFPLAVLAIAGALSALPVTEGWPLNHGYGGLLGDAIFNLISRLFATINATRADLAASLVLFAAALTMSGKTIGFDSDELLTMAAKSVRSLREKRRVARREEPSDTETRSRGWWPWTRSERAERNDDAPGIASSLNARGEALRYDVNRAPQYVNYPQAETGFDPRFQSQPAGQPDPSAHFQLAIDPQLPPQQRFETGQDFDRGLVFDRSTDAASVAMAKRFAPVSASEQSEMPSHGASTPPPPASSREPHRGSGMLGGFAARASEPAWKRPSINFLRRPTPAKHGPESTQAAMRGNARLLEDVLADFGVKGEVKDIRPGPVITLYELEPSRGTKSSRVIGLADDIARSMSVASIRAAVVAGRNAIGLELPNVRRDPVVLREILESEAYKSSEATLPLALGKTIGGDPVVADLARMPHLLVAGTTGSGKSVGINAFVLSLLYRHAPEDCKLIMIDPKMLELSVYNGIPHLLTPVVTDPQKAVAALNWAVSEMEERYKRMAALNVRGIDMFNNRVRNAKKRGERLSRTVQTGFDKFGQAKFETQKLDAEPLPHIVIVVDEFADLMIAAGKDVETAVQRLAQMARAAGIHLIMATQRPSVDIITGTIKANFPTRISFKVTSKIDSRTILNEQGAEQLLGQGDMLYSTGAGHVMRVHGAFVSDDEVEAIADALRRQGTPTYVDGICDVAPPSEIASGAREPSEDDLYDRAVAIVMRDRKASTSYLQRRLSIGYNRAADLIERMEREGLISPANAVGKRDISAGPAAIHGGKSDAA